jgi:hypothetical protein
MKQHTPGPWALNTCEENGPFLDSFYLSANEERIVCRFPTGTGQFSADGQTNLANAQLISAAPDLLDALEAIEARINGVYDCPALVAFGPLHHDTQWDCLRIAKEAIAKAKGEA